MLAKEFGIIEDGYSFDAVIERVPGVHPEVKLKFRPALAEERMQLLHVPDAKDRVAKIAAILKRHLESWDLRLRPKADGAEIIADCRDEAILKRLQPTLQSKLLDLVLGYSPVQEAADEKN